VILPGGDAFKKERNRGGEVSGKREFVDKELRGDIGKLEEERSS